MPVTLNTFGCNPCKGLRDARPNPLINIQLIESLRGGLRAGQVNTQYTATSKIGRGFAREFDPWPGSFLN
jgi:hypothetical protein